MMKSLDWKSLAAFAGFVAAGFVALLLIERNVLAKLPPQMVGIGVIAFAALAFAVQIWRILTRRT